MVQMFERLTSRSTARRPLVSWWTVGTALGLVLTAAAVGPVGAVSAHAPGAHRAEATDPGGEGATIALVGQFEAAQEATAWRLVDGGIYDIDVGLEGVGPATELVLVTVSAVDGPMPSTRAALESMDGSTIPRIAIVLTRTADQPDAELLALVTIETNELLTSFGVVDPEVPVVNADDPDFVPQIAALLDGPPADYQPTTPVAPAPADLVTVDSMRGVPSDLAPGILVEQGLSAVVVVDPSAGVVSDCHPQVLDQFPEPGAAVPAGTLVALTVAQPDPLLVGEECRLTEFASQVEFDQYIDQVLGQAGLPELPPD